MAAGNMRDSIARAPEVVHQERHELLRGFLQKRTLAFYRSVMTGNKIVMSDGVEIVAPDFFFGDHEPDRRGMFIMKPFIYDSEQGMTRGVARSFSLKTYATTAVPRKEGNFKWEEDMSLASCAQFLDHGRSFVLLNRRVNIQRRTLQPHVIIDPGFSDFPAVEPTVVELARSGGGWSRTTSRLKLVPAECQMWDLWLARILAYYRPALEEVGLFSTMEAATDARSVKSNVLEAMLETFCPASNTCFTPVGELGFSLLEMKQVSGLPISGDLYEEYFPTDEELNELETSPHQFSRRRGRALRNLYKAHFTLASKEPRSRVLIRKWLEYFSSDKRISAGLKQGSNAKPCALDEMNTARYEELTVFLSCWLSRYLFPDSSGDYVRVEIMMPAMLLSQGIKLALCSPMVARLCRLFSSFSSPFLAFFVDFLCSPAMMRL